MKVIAVTDLHYNLQQFDWLFQVAERFDYVILGGDLINVAGFLEIELQVTVISEYLQKLSQTTNVLVCSGNHDVTTKDENGEYVASWLKPIASESLFVDGQAVQNNGVLFSVCPWWDGPKSRSAMADMLTEHGQLPHDKWVWLHHAPPDASRVSWTGKRHGGDKFLNQLLEQHKPTFVISGHIHNAPFYQAGGWIDRVHDTWACNPGHQPGPAPTTIQLDLDTMAAVFDSSEGRETADLSDLDVVPFAPQ